MQTPTEQKETPPTLSTTELLYLWIMRYNRLADRIEIEKTWRIGRLGITFNWRSKKNLMGRFGGGWIWCVGIQVGSSTVIINLLVCSLRIEIDKKAKGEPDANSN